MARDREGPTSRPRKSVREQEPARNREKKSLFQAVQKRLIDASKAPGFQTSARPILTRTRTACPLSRQRAQKEESRRKRVRAILAENERIKGKQKSLPRRREDRLPLATWNEPAWGTRRRALLPLSGNRLGRRASGRTRAVEVSPAPPRGEVDERNRSKKETSFGTNPRG